MHCLFDILWVKTVFLFFNLWITLRNHLVKHSLKVFSSVTQSCPTLWDPMQHSRLPCPSPIPVACSNLCPPSRWCHPTISSSLVPFSSCLQSFPESGSFPMSQFFTSGGQSIGASAFATFKKYLKYVNMLQPVYNVLLKIRVVDFSS